MLLPPTPWNLSLANSPLQLDASSVTVSIDETTTLADVDQLFSILNGGKGERGWGILGASVGWHAVVVLRGCRALEVLVLSPASSRWAGLTCQHRPLLHDCSCRLHR